MNLTNGNWYLVHYTNNNSITTAGKTLSTLGFINVSGTLTLNDALTTRPDGYIRTDGGTTNTNNQTVTTGNFYVSTVTAKTITLGSSIINTSGSGWDMTIGGGAVTVTANTATINISGTGALVGGNVNYNGATFNLIGTAHTITGNFTCNSLTYHPTTHTNANVLTMTSGSTVTTEAGFVLVGNARSTQILVQSSTLGTAATITCANWTGSDNFDLMDITATNAVNFQTLGFMVGDCGGNTGITFPTAVPQTFTYGGVDYKFSTVGNWLKTSDGTAGRIPLVGIDNVTMQSADIGSGKTIIWDMPRMGKSIDFSGMSWTGTATTVTPSSTITLFGSLVLKTGITWTTGTSSTYFRGRGNYTITTAGATIYSLRIGAPTGTYTIQDSFIVSNILENLAGTLNTNNQTGSSGLFYFDGTTTRTVTLGSSVITLNNSGVSDKVRSSSTGLTLNAGTSTIILTNSGTNAQTFAGDGLQYNNVTVAGAGNYQMTMTGNNSFNNFTVDRSVASKSIVATGTTQTVTNFVAETSSTRTVTITGGTWNKVGVGIVSLDYMSISGSTATPALVWYAVYHSTDGGGNSGWIFRGLVTSSPATDLYATLIGARQVANHYTALALTGEDDNDG